MKALFVDTNVIIDVLANREPFSESAAHLFQLAEKGAVTLYISALSYATIYYIIKKTCSHSEMVGLLRDLEALATTLAVNDKVIVQAINSEFKDFEDAIQYYTAIASSKVAAIITRNPKDFKLSALPVFTPEEAVSLLVQG